jgi:hypothetical protein
LDVCGQCECTRQHVLSLQDYSCISRPTFATQTVCVPLCDLEWLPARALFVCATPISISKRLCAMNFLLLRIVHQIRRLYRSRNRGTSILNCTGFSDERARSATPSRENTLKPTQRPQTMISTPHSHMPPLPIAPFRRRADRPPHHFSYKFPTF